MGSVLGDVLAEARRRAGMTQRQLEAVTGIPQTMISSYEVGRNQPGDEKLRILLAATGATIRLGPTRSELLRSVAGSMRIERRDPGSTADTVVRPSAPLSLVKAIRARGV